MNTQVKPHRAESVGAVVVVYQPDMDRLQQLVVRLSTQVAAVALVNNGSVSSIRVDSFVAFDSPEAARIKVLNPGQNLGVAAALNQGIRCLEARGCTLAWSFDQDSLPDANALDMLLGVWPHDAHVAALAPAICQQGRARPLPYLLTDAAGAVRAQTLDAAQEIAAAITSGLLVRIDVWQAVGGALETLFIDHVDTEWCNRARAAGWRILAAPSARISHQLGEPGPCFAGVGARPVVLRPPLRTYYMLRNGWLLGQMQATPAGWRRYQRRQAAKIIAVALLHGPQRREQLSAILRAVRDAWRSYSWVH